MHTSHHVIDKPDSTDVCRFRNILVEADLYDTHFLKSLTGNWKLKVSLSSMAQLLMPVLRIFPVVPAVVRVTRVRDKRCSPCQLSRSASWRDSYSFLSNLAQKKHRSLFRIHVMFDTRLAPSGRFIPQAITATNSPFLPPNAIFHFSPDKYL